MKLKIRDIDDLRTCLMQTWSWFGFEQNTIDAVVDQWYDCLRSCVCADGGKLNTCCEIIVHLYYVVHRNIL